MSMVHVDPQAPEAALHWGHAAAMAPTLRVWGRCFHLLLGGFHGKKTWKTETCSQKAAQNRIQYITYNTRTSYKIIFVELRRSKKKIWWITGSSGLPWSPWGLRLSPVGLWCFPGVANPDGQGTGAGWWPSWRKQMCLMDFHGICGFNGDRFFLSHYFYHAILYTLLVTVFTVVIVAMVSLLFL